MKKENNTQIYSDQSKIDPLKWSEFNRIHPDGNFFQSPEAYDFFSKIDHYFPFIIWASEGNEIIGLISGVTIKEPGLKSSFSIRTIVWGGPLIKKDEDLCIDLLVYLGKINKSSIYIEFRNLFNTNKISPGLKALKYKFKPHLNYVVKLDTIEENQKKLSKSKLRQIRSSLKNGVEICEANNEDQVKDFYRILKELYTKKVKKPLPRIEFFLTFFHSPALGKILVLKYQNKIIGGIVCPIFDNKIIYEMYVAGEDGKHKGIFSSVLTTWAPIEYGINNGIQFFDFLGAGSPDSDYGVREFKSKFGGELVEYGRYIKLNKPVLYLIGKTALKVIAKFKET